jgi:diadenylate cyclase
LLVLTKQLSALGRLDWSSIIDILLVALVFYLLLRLFQGTQAVQLLRGIIFLVLAIIVLSSLLDLRAFTWLMRNSLPALLVAIPVIFQPELRRALERLGRTEFLFGRLRGEEVVQQVIEEIVMACETLSERRHGALIVLERTTGLQDFIDTGSPIDSAVSSEMLQTIFYPNTALHDGAVVIRGDRIVAARVVLPLAQHLPVHGHLGTRHRAALGISEQTDAVTIVVSEETGTISVAHNGRMIRRLGRERLRNVLRTFYDRGALRSEFSVWWDKVTSRLRR